MGIIKALQRIHKVHDENSLLLDLSLVTVHEYKALSMNRVWKRIIQKSFFEGSPRDDHIVHYAALNSSQ